MVTLEDEKWAHLLWEKEHIKKYTPPSLINADDGLKTVILQIALQINVEQTFLTGWTISEQRLACDRN